MSIGDILESLSQGILVGIILVGILGVLPVPERGGSSRGRASFLRRLNGYLVLQGHPKTACKKKTRYPLG